MTTLAFDTFGQNLDEAVRRFPERTAVRGWELTDGPPREFTYAELDAAASELAADLRAAGAARFEPAIVFVSNRVEDMITLLGAWRAGLVAVPLHRECSPETLRQILCRTGARFLVMGQPPPDLDLPPWEHRMRRHSSLLANEGVAPAHREELAGAALVMFTSGSTGEPKGVILTREAFSKKLAAINAVLRLPEGVRSFLVLQLNFAFGQWVSLLTLMLSGTVFLLPKFEPERVLRLLGEEQIGHIAVVPTMLRALRPFMDADAAQAPLRLMRSGGFPHLICTGGEPLQPALARAMRRLLPRSGIADVFGLTETCTSDFILPPDSFDQHIGSIGFPSPGVRFRIVNPETGEDSGSGEAGELEIDSDFMMAGYLGAPDLTRSSFRGKYFRTGDIARVGPDGAVYLSGRSKDLIVRGGNKVSPIEVDGALMQHPQVLASLTTGVPDAVMGERIHSLVVAQDGCGLTELQLRDWARSKLDKFKLPDRIHFGAKIPQGRTGKDDRKALWHWLTEQNLVKPVSTQERD